jgi:hypothetical protein
MFSRVLERRGILVGLEVGVDELDKAVQVFGCDLQSVSLFQSDLNGYVTYSIVLLVKIVHVAVQDLNKQLHGHCGIHACIGDTERTLQTFEYSFSIAVELWKSVKIRFQ